MKKSILILLLAALLMTVGGSVTAAEKGANTDSGSAARLRISPALDVLANELTLTKTGLVAKEIRFSASDFEKTMGVSHLDSITLLTLPSAECGTLYLATTPAMVGQVITRESIASLRFVPVGKEEFDCSFVFGTVSTSQPLAVTCELHLINGLNFAPTAAPADGEGEGLTVSTLSGIPVYGKLTSNDPENDQVRYRITAYPSRGTLRMTDRKAGSFCYTPVDGYVGEDSFSYVAVDSYGNESSEQNVALAVEASTTALTYCDMEGSEALLPAMRLAEKGVMIGETIGSSAYFHPAKEVTKAEFLAMTLCAADIEVPDSYTETAFADAADIPEYLRKYVSFASQKRYIEGEQTDEGVCFYPNRTVTYAEAAVILQNVLNLEASAAQEVFMEEEALPVSVQNAVWAVAEAGIFPDGAFAADSAVNRADAACMLAAVLMQE